MRWSAGIAVIVVAVAFMARRPPPPSLPPPSDPPQHTPLPIRTSSPEPTPSPSATPEPTLPPLVSTTLEPALEGEPSPKPLAAMEDVPPPATPTSSPRMRKVSRLIKLDAGTNIVVRLSEALDTRTTSEEHAFAAAIAKRVKAFGKVLIEEGALAEGLVARVDRPGAVAGRARLDLELRRVETVDGWMDVRTRILKKEKSGAPKDAARVGVGALIGGIIGGVVDGKRGAKRGAVVGGAAGVASTTVTRGPQVALKRGEKLEFELERPLLIELDEEGDR